MPATMEEKHPNWSLGLPKPIEDLMSGELAARIAKALSRDE